MTTNPRKTYTTPNTELQQLRIFYEKSEKITKTWFKEWNWLVEEYRKLQNEIGTVSKKSTNENRGNVLVSSGHDGRSIFPVPNSVNHEYGWIANREDFKLEKYGPDLHKLPVEENKSN